MDNVISFYSEYDEDSRLTTNKARRIEFDVTTSILDPFIKKDSKTLELGAGTGVYSLHYAKLGSEVVATDLTPKHVDIMNDKIKHLDSSVKIEARIVNAVDLSSFSDASFDQVLSLGPFYHLIDEQDRINSLDESLRVLKKNGILAIAYINKNYMLHSTMLRNKELLKEDFIDQILETGVIKEGESYSFWTDAFFTSPSEMEDFLNSYNLEIIEHIATDGISPFIRDKFDEMTDEQYSTWLYYFKKACKDKNIIGLSNHGLIICRKLG